VGNAAYFVTTCTAEQHSIFSDNANAQIVVDAIRWLRERGRVWILGYVVMPDHVHLMMVLREGHCLASVMRVWKGFASRRLSRRIGRGAPIWQDGYYDHMVRNSKDLRDCLAYMHYNPVRKGFADDPERYAFSTANPALADDVDAWWMV
jgi:REP element-mobilizing transposase RayT